MAMLQSALALLVESKKQELMENGVSDDKLQNEVAVALLADLQEKQTCENNAMSKVLIEKVSSSRRCSGVLY